MSMWRQFTKTQLRLWRVQQIFNVLEVRSHTLLDRILAKQRKSLQLITQIHDEQQMPLGWKEVYDEEENKIYFIDEKTGRSSWFIPQEVLDRRIRTVLSTAQTRWNTAQKKVTAMLALEDWVSSCFIMMYPQVLLTSSSYDLINNNLLSFATISITSITTER